MKREHLKQLIKGKRSWTEPLSSGDAKLGFKSWYASKNLPHFDAPGTRQFFTYRLSDALPASRRSEWEGFLQLEDEHEKQRKIEAYMDKGYGECQLRNPQIASLVQDNLWYYDGIKYRLLAWVIMTNHVHVLVEIWQVPLGDVLKDWKGYTAKAINKILGRRGAFWEDDYFDRYLRDETHYQRVVNYIENNLNKAGLVRAPADWLWSSARYRGEPGLAVPVLTHSTAKRSPFVKE